MLHDICAWGWWGGHAPANENITKIARRFYDRERSQMDIADCSSNTRFDGWTPRNGPPSTPLVGRTCRVERLCEATHGPALAEAFASPPANTWEFLPYGPFDDAIAFQTWLAGVASKPDPFFHAIIDNQTNRPAGLASLMRIDPANGVIEVGHIHFGPSLQRTTAATEAIFLLMSRVFDELGYRRLEWKCNALNDASRKAAIRFGFTYEGTFRQAAIVKGRNRDTAWFSLLDTEWPTMKTAFTSWLAPDNFDDFGNQRRRLSDIMA